MVFLQLLLAFQSSQLVFCQIGVNLRQCLCKPSPNPPNQFTLALYSFRLIDYEICLDNIIRFKFKNTAVCGTAYEDWVQKLKDCFDTRNFMECRRKVPKIDTEVNILSTTVTTTNQDRSVSSSTMRVLQETQTVLLVDMPATTNTTSSRQNWETDLTEQGSMDKNIKDPAHIPSGSPAPPEKDKIKQMTVTIISLLGIVFILVGITTFLICRRKAGDLERSRKTYCKVNMPESSRL